MAEGTVKYFDATRGYGFIETKESEDDIFFHVSDMDGQEPVEGERLTFEIRPAARGPRAENVTRG